MAEEVVREDGREDAGAVRRAVVRHDAADVNPAALEIAQGAREKARSRLFRFVCEHFRVPEARAGVRHETREPTRCDSRLGVGRRLRLPLASQASNVHSCGCSQVLWRLPVESLDNPSLALLRPVNNLLINYS